MKEIRVYLFGFANSRGLASLNNRRQCCIVRGRKRIFFFTNLGFFLLVKLFSGVLRCSLAERAEAGPTVDERGPVQ